MIANISLEIDVCSAARGCETNATQIKREVAELLMRYTWKNITRQQVGAFSEYFVKMELTMYGFQVYSSEVDDRGIDFVARYRGGPFLSVQVKSLRGTGYVFMRKQHFALTPELYLALALLREEEEPELFLIPSIVWKAPNNLFVSRDYEGLQSSPEWGINVSKKNMDVLRNYSFAEGVKNLLKSAP